MMIRAPTPEQTQMTRSTMSPVRPMGAVSASVVVDAAGADDDDDIVIEYGRREAQRR